MTSWSTFETESLGHFVFEKRSKDVKPCAESDPKDVALQKLPVRFILDRAGLVGADGATHCGAFDLSYLSPGHLATCEGLHVF